MTINDLLIKTIKQLSLNNLPIINASKLIAHFEKIKLEEIPLNLNKQLTLNINNFNNALKKHLDSQPLEQILGYVNSTHGIKLLINKHVLIPRSETYELIELILPIINKNTKVLDMCTGSGLIGIHLAKRKEAIITISDISKEALLIAKKNIKLNKIKNIEVIESDLFKNIDGKYDVIVANPPYIAFNDKTVDIRVIKHDPHLALFAKENGLKIIFKILSEYKKYINKKSLLALEFGETQKELINDFLIKNGIKNYNFYKDINGKDRFLIISS